MAIFKCTFIFASGAQGWSEVWYQDVSTLQNAVVPCENLVGTRFPLLGTGCIIEAVRISTITRPYKSRLLAVSLANPSSLPPADTSWNTILGQANDSTQVYRRVVQLRGVRDEWIVRDATGLPVPPANNAVFKNRWDAYIASLRQNLFRFKMRSQEGANGVLTNATDFQRETDGRLSFAASGVPGGPGDFVTLGQVTGIGASQYTQGRLKIKSNNGTRIITETVVPNDVFPPGWSAGKVQPYVAGYWIVHQGEALRYSHRDTGRRFFVTRGRRPKRRASPS